MELNEKSLARLVGVKEPLQILVKLAASRSKTPFQITEGVRTMERQKELLATKKTQTLKSYHLVGKAIDFVAMPEGKVSWDWKYYEEIARVFKECAEELNIKITWGGDWKSFKDGPHIQLEE